MMRKRKQIFKQDVSFGPLVRRYCFLSTPQFHKHCYRPPDLRVEDDDDDGGDDDHDNDDDGDDDDED